MRRKPFLHLCASIFLPAWLLACTPTYDWREVHGAGVPFMALMPAKPSVHSQTVDLGGVPVMMTMTAAEIGSNVFAVGAARMPAGADAAAALKTMKIAMVRNINGTISKEKSSAGQEGNTLSIEVEAAGAIPAGPRFLSARFVARGDRVYQAVVVGSGNAAPRDAVDMFLSSFKPE